MNMSGIAIPTTAYLELTDAARQQLSLSDTLKVVYGVFTRLVGFDRAGVFLYDSVTERIEGSWGTDARGNLQSIEDESYQINANDLLAWESLKMGGKGSYYRHFEEADNREDFPPEMQTLRDHGTIYLGTVNDLVGYIAVDNLLTERPFNQDDLEQLVPLANYAAVVVLNARAREQQAANEARQRRINEISLAISSNESLEMVLKMIRNAIIEIGFVDRAAVWIVRDSVAYGTWGTGYDGQLSLESQYSFDLVEDHFEMLSSSPNKPPYGIDTFRVELPDGTVHPAVPHAYLPLRSGDELVGLVTVDNLFTGNLITPAMLDLVLPIADQAAATIHKFRLIQSQTETLEQQRRIIDLAVAITANEDPDNVFRMIRDAVLETKTVDRVGVWLVDGEQALGTWGTSSDGSPRDEHHIQFSILEMLRDYSACLVDDEDVVINPNHKVLAMTGEIITNVPYAVIPMKAGSSLIGMLTLDNVISKRPFSKERLAPIFPLAKLAAVVVQKSHLLKAAQQEIWRRTAVEEQLQIQATELIEARDAALAGSRAKSQFLASMSHEIRTPMNGVLGMTSMLMQTHLSEEQYDYARVIQESAKALLSVIEDILDISKLEAGMVRVEQSNFDLRECLEDVSEIISSQLDTRTVELNCFIPADFPDLLIGDGGRIRQMVTNLIGNAVKFTVSGEISVSTRVIKESDHDAWIEIKVKDTGIGIPTEKLETIFQAFTQLDSGYTRKHSGSGLGLTITQQLVTLLGGTIQVESQVGVGSTFTIELPIRKQTVQKIVECPEIVNKNVVLVIKNSTKCTNVGHYLVALGAKVKCLHSLSELDAYDEIPDLYLLDDDLFPASMQSESLSILPFTPDEKRKTLLMVSVAQRHLVINRAISEHASILVKPVRLAHLIRCIQSLIGNVKLSNNRNRMIQEEPSDLGLHILLAEDNDINSMVACARLEKWGCTVRVAENGHEALTAVEEESFDVILMDVSMPMMDGLEATKEIRLRELHTGKHVPIIALTAHAFEEDRKTCVDAGMDDFISKPIDFPLLLEKLVNSAPRD